MTPRDFARTYRVTGAKFNPNGTFQRWTGVPTVGKQLLNPKSRIRINCPNWDLLNFVIALLPFAACEFVYGLAHIRWSLPEGYALAYYPRNNEGYIEFKDLFRASDVPVIMTEDERHNRYSNIGRDSDPDVVGDYREDDRVRDAHYEG